MSFPLKELTLRKITLDNNVKCILTVENSPSEISRDHKPKIASNHGKQNSKRSKKMKTLSQNYQQKNSKLLNDEKVVITFNKRAYGYVD